MNQSLPTTSGRVFRSDAPLAAAPGLLRVGTRGSALAVSQTTTVAEQIAAATGLDVALVIVTTHGDVTRAPLSQLGGTGVFVSALRDALLAGECDLAVHSLKDLPTGACPGIALGAVPVRADARDALCARDGLTLASLPAGARIGTGSPRRVAQIRSRRPDVEVHDLRGNVDTRLGRVGVDLDAVVLAAAGLDRIGRAEAIAERFPLTDAPAAPGQGALAIEVREADAAQQPYAAALAALDHSESRATALAERALLATLEAGCAAPIGACAEVSGETLRLRAVVYRVDGSAQLAAEAELPWSVADIEDRAAGTASPSTAVPSAAVPSADVPAELGRRVAAELLAAGAAELAPLGSGA